MSNFPVEGLPVSLGTVGATAVDVKARPFEVDAFIIVNQTAAEAFVQVFNNKHADAVVGTPDWFIPLPASGGVAIALPKSVRHSIACSVACCTTPTGNTPANCDVTFFGR